MTHPRSVTRRQFTRLVAAGSLALVAGGALAAKPVAAGVTWCRSDPLVTVNGKTGHVYVDSTADMFASATGPIKIDVLVPFGMLEQASAVPLDDGFGHGYEIEFKEDKKLRAAGSWTEVRIKAKAPALDGSLPVRVTFHADDPDLSDSVKTGVANEEILTGGVKI